MHMIALVILTLTIYGKTAHGLSQELRDHALMLHNNYRKGVEGACQMERMQYDMELERQATEWANKCVFQHEIIEGRGENLAWNSAKKPEPEMMNISSKAWYDEVNMYSYGQYSCGSSCHYTQMVWATTNKVGCATKRCSYLINAYPDSWYFVCFYLPGGNMNGEKPYQTTCDTPCKDGQTQDSDGLCIAGGSGENDSGEEVEGTGAPTGTGSTSQPAGSTGAGTTSETDEVCEDKDSRCEGWAKTGECTDNPDYMHKDCRKACALCGDGTATGGGGNTGGTESGSGGGDKKPEPCVDKDSSCPRWFRDGECQKNPNYMLENCKKSCKVCVSEEGTEEENTGENGGGKDKEGPCEDKDSRCPDWSRGGQCKSNPGYMLKNCEKSCEVCSGPSGEETGGTEEEKEKEPCVDKDNRCPRWARGNQCHSNPGYMLKNCRKSCKVCSSTDGEQTGGTEKEKEPCVDKDNRCTGWASGKQCQSNPGYMLKNCRKSCKVCDSEGEDETTNEGNTGGNGGGQDNGGKEEPCKDKTTQCVNWHKSGECEKNPSYMLKNCRKSCRVCTVKGEEEAENSGDNNNKKETSSGEREEESQGDQGHEDKGTDCGKGKGEPKGKEESKDEKETSNQQSSKGNEENNTDEEVLEESCPKDKKKCRYWRKRKLCTKNRKFMERHCKRACGFCTP